jgi:pSer/pThr/pTyr-binding forkhead associated (FHA) protein
MPMLSVQDALGERLVALEKLPFTMGRRANNELRLGSPEVSGEHAEIVQDGGSYRLRDKQSRFGTFVNGEAVTDRELRSGDRIRLGLRGGANLVFRAVEGARLRIQLGSGEALQHDLVGRQTSVGRSLASDVVIPDASISRQHAVIFRTEEGYFIEDASSRNGVAVNGERILSTFPLRAGDQLLFGTCRATFDLREDVNAPATTDTGTATLTPTSWRRLIGATALGASLAPPADTRRNALPTDISRQLDAARSIQKLLLPHASPPVAGYRIFGDSQPCYAVGGDFYDFFALEGGRVGFVLGDVSGKGLGAALLAHFTQASIRTALRYESRLDRVLPRLNEDICERSLENQFVTLCVCVLDTASGNLEYVNAGHCPPLIVRTGGETCFLEDSSPILGVSTTFTYDVQRVRLEPESAVVLYSDGFTECSTCESLEFGAQRFAHFFAKRATLCPEVIARELEDYLAQFGVGACQTDDMTLVLVQREAFK